MSKIGLVDAVQSYQEVYRLCNSFECNRNVNKPYCQLFHPHFIASLDTSFITVTQRSTIEMNMDLAQLAEICVMVVDSLGSIITIGLRMRIRVLRKLKQFKLHCFGLRQCHEYDNNVEHHIEEYVDIFSQFIKTYTYVCAVSLNLLSIRIHMEHRYLC